MLTTAEAAALLSERGMTDKDGGPVRVETVQQWCKRGKFAGAVSVGGRIWQIPREAVETFGPPTQGRPRHQLAAHTDD